MRVLQPSVSAERCLMMSWASNCPETRHRSTSMRTGLRVQAAISDTQPFHRPPSDQVLIHNLGGVLRFHVAIPDCLWINDDGWPVLALVKAPGFVDAHGSAKACCLG